MSTPKLINIDFVKNLTSIGKCGFWRSNIEFDWSSLTGCTFGDNATHLQVNPTDFWSNLNPTPCENPIPTQLCQKDDRWVNQNVGNSNYLYGTHGCTLICMAHGYSGLTGKAFSTVTEFENELNAIIPDWINLFDRTSTGVKNILLALGCSATQYNSWDKDRLEAMYNTLTNGGYAIVTIGTTGGHMITVYGINEKGELLCIDSEKKYFYDSSKPAIYTLPFHKLIDDSGTFVLVSK